MAPPQKLEYQNADFQKNGEEKANQSPCKYTDFFSGNQKTK
jgi:hypothetical protein